MACNEWLSADSWRLPYFHLARSKVWTGGGILIHSSAAMPPQPCLPSHASRLASLAAAFLLTLPSFAQIPNTLLHTLPAPATLQSGAQLGFSVAVSGGYTVVGAPFDDTGGGNSGVVKVFDSTSGALLHVLTNPSPNSGDNFGNAVAIDGTRVVVGAYLDDTGATDSGMAYVYDLAGASPTVPIFTLNNPTPAATDYFGYSVSISGTRVAVGVHRDDTAATDAGAVYVYDLGGATPSLPVLSLFNPGPPEGDYFGFSVGISGTRVVVGAVRDDTGATDAGSVYVYDIAGATPAVPVVTLTNPGPADSDQLGRSVAISGTRVVVGAFQDDTGGTDAGSVYVYDVTSATPSTPVATLNNPGPAPVGGDQFGLAVAISGLRVVVGAWRDDVGASNAGSAYVYDLGSGTPTVPVVTLNNPASAATDQFGFAVAISGTAVVVGANLDDAGESDAGSAYVYNVGSATPSVPVVTLNNPGPAVNDQFGVAVAVSGSLIVVAANLDDTPLTDGGTVFVYDRNSATPTVPVYALTVPVSGSQFGGAVAISGTRVVVGAQFDDTGVNNAGRAYVFDLSSATPTVPIVALANPDPESNDLFGRAVSIAGNLVVVSAHGDDTGAMDAGIAYVFDLNSATPGTPVFTLNNPTPEASDVFGYSVSISGTRVVVGAYQDKSLPGTSGSAYVFDVASATPTVPVVTLHSTAMNTFGLAVSISGTRVVVGAHTDDAGAADAGSAYVYDISSATPAVPVVTLNNPFPAASDWFGRAVAISGTRVVVTAWQDDAGAMNAGSAYVYDLTSATPAVPVATLMSPTPDAGDEFGRAVAIDGTTVVVGALYDDITQVNEGAVYLFGPHPLDQDSDGLRDTWEVANFGTTTGHGPLDDEDKDGYVELLELAFGLNPNEPNPGGLPAVVNEGGYLTMTITKQPGVLYEVQSAGTLEAALPASFSPASTTILVNNATTLKARDNVPLGGAAQRFLRAKVTAAP